ncbi:MAG: hypothetical protein V7K14_28350 [Nostoc sp.]|nr:hypothetical protein [Nostoc sp. NMS7]MBN3950623.1 hypothetical protein [Nostoc sp. NMS7]
MTKIFSAIANYKEREFEWSSFQVAAISCNRRNPEEICIFKSNSQR